MCARVCASLAIYTVCYKYVYTLTYIEPRARYMPRAISLEDPASRGGRFNMRYLRRERERDGVAHPPCIYIHCGNRLLRSGC